MPIPVIKKYASESGKSIDDVENYWKDAKKSADEAWNGKKKDDHYWAYVTSIVKKRCGLSESLSFREFVELQFHSSSNDTHDEENDKYGIFVSTLFAARDKAHELHLSSKTHSQHVTLNEFYDMIVDFVDKMTETFQGKHGLINVKIPATDITFKQLDAIDFISDFCKWLETSGRKLQGDDSFVINLYDEFLGDVYRIKYKIDNLT